MDYFLGLNASDCGNGVFIYYFYIVFILWILQDMFSIF
jgi:hypothetical protein